MNIFIVTAGWDYEGTCGQWAFTDEAAARMQFELYAAKLRDGDEDTKGDYVTLRGPFTLGENMCDYSSAKLIAHCNPAGRTMKNTTKRGTVGWLIAELQKFPEDMEVLHGDYDDAYYEPSALEVMPIKEGYINEKRGEMVVCIRA